MELYMAALQEKQNTTATTAGNSLSDDYMDMTMKPKSPTLPPHSVRTSSPVEEEEDRETSIYVDVDAPVPPPTQRTTNNPSLYYNVHQNGQVKGLDEVVPPRSNSQLTGQDYYNMNNKNFKANDLHNIYVKPNQDYYNVLSEKNLNTAAPKKTNNQDYYNMSNLRQSDHDSEDYYNVQPGSSNPSRHSEVVTGRPARDASQIYVNIAQSDPTLYKPDNVTPQLPTKQNHNRYWYECHKVKWP